MLISLFGSYGAVFWGVNGRWLRMGLLFWRSCLCRTAQRFAP